MAPKCRRLFVLALKSRAPKSRRPSVGAQKSHAQMSPHRACCMLYDSGREDQQRFFIFSTGENLRLSKENRDWFADGTFKMAPQLFYQVHTIHVMCHGSVLPVV